MNTLKDNANENNSKQITMDAAIQNRHCVGSGENVREIGAGEMSAVFQCTQIYFYISTVLSA